MKSPGTTRRTLIAALPCAVLFVAGGISLMHAQSGNPPAPIVRMPPPQGNQPRAQGLGPRQPGPPRGAHLGQWMQQHGGMSTQQQQQALEREPGFSQLPPQTQQRMMQRLNRLNTMPEQQRERVLSRNEAMERMTPQQRGDVRSAMGQLGLLRQDRRRAVARSFRELRSMPPAERNAYLNSPEFHQQFSDEERGTLGNLLSVSPLLPPSR